MCVSSNPKVCDPGKHCSAEMRKDLDGIGEYHAKHNKPEAEG